MATKYIKKIATAPADISGLKSSRYEKLQVSYGVIASTDYTIGDTLVFSDVPSQDIIRATVIAHSASPAVLDIYPGSDNSGTFTLDLPNVFTASVKLSYIIEYIRGTGRVGASSGDNSGEGELLKVIIQSGAVNDYSPAVAESQIADDSD
jgi:hypothetical protein